VVYFAMLGGIGLIALFGSSSWLMAMPELILRHFNSTNNQISGHRVELDFVVVVVSRCCPIGSSPRRAREVTGSIPLPKCNTGSAGRRSWCAPSLYGFAIEDPLRLSCCYSAFSSLSSVGAMAVSAAGVSDRASV